MSIKQEMQDQKARQKPIIHEAKNQPERLKVYLDTLESAGDKDLIGEHLKTYQTFSEGYTSAFTSLFASGYRWLQFKDLFKDSEFRELPFGELAKRHQELRAHVSELEECLPLFEKLSELLQKKSDDISRIAEDLWTLHDKIFENRKILRRRKARERETGETE